MARPQKKEDAFALLVNEEEGDDESDDVHGTAPATARGNGIRRLFSRASGHAHDNVLSSEATNLHGLSHGHGHGHGGGIAGLAALRRVAVLQHFYRLAGGERVYLAVGVFGLLVSAGVNLFLPWSLGNVLKGGAQGDSFGHVVRMTLLYLFVYLGGAAMTTVRTYAFMISGERIVRRVRSDLFRSILSRPIAFFDRQRTGDLLNRISADCEVIRQAITFTMVQVVRCGIQVVGGAAFLFYISWQLTLVLLCIIPVLGVAGLVYSRVARRLSLAVQASLARNAGAADEVLGGIRHVRAYGGEPREAARFDGLLGETFSLASRQVRAQAIFLGGAEFGAYAAVLLVILYGTRQIMDGRLLSSSLTEYILYAVYVSHALGAISHQSAEVAKAVGASERVIELLNTAPRSQEGGQWPDTVRGEVEFRNVSLAYGSIREDGTYAEECAEGVSSALSLKNVSFRVTAGESVGIVGSSGSGKSSTLGLVLRFYEPMEGAVHIDGMDIRDMDPRCLRENIAYVSQEAVLFCTTVAENVRYGRPDAPIEDVQNACRAAHIHDFVMSLPEQYETVVGERGSLLSGGQKQRLSIARALLKNAPIVLLDEPTSALDAESEKGVQEALRTLLAGRTCLFVTHRLEPMRRMSRVLVMSGGAIVEEGPHDALIARDGIYAKLYSLQAQ